MPEDSNDPHALQLATSTEGDQGVVSASGELDANSAGHLRDACDEVFAQGQAALVLDLAGITFIDSSGLSALIYAYKQAGERHATLTLRSSSPAVKRLLEMTGQFERFLGPEA